MLIIDDASQRIQEIKNLNKARAKKYYDANKEIINAQRRAKRALKNTRILTHQEKNIDIIN